MMNPIGAERRKSSSTGKLIAFGIASFLILIMFAGIALFWPLLQKLFFAPYWDQEMRQAATIWYNDREKAEPMITDAFSKAESAHAPIANIMHMHRTYAGLLYGVDDWQSGNDQIAAAIALCPKNPAPNSAEADQLTHAYQDRAWDSHKRYLKDKTVSSGKEDQEISVLIAERSFGPEHEQTVYKLPTLAVIYSDIGSTDKAHEVMQRAINAVEKNASDRQCAWFVYALDARMKAAEHDYKGAVKSYLKARTFAGGKEQKDRIWEEFSDGLTQNRTEDHSDLKIVHSWFSQGKFEQLDELASKLRKAQTPEADGLWDLDGFYDKLLDEDNATENDFQQHLFDLKNWMKRLPQSSTARVAMGKSLVGYAWLARGGGYADSVSDQAEKLFELRLAQAKAVMDADPRIKIKCPRAFKVYSAIARGQGMDKALYLNMIDECHKTWPAYHTIDNSACMFLLPRWYGAPGEVEQFITSRADAVGGSRGDELYAQLIWNNQDYLDSLFQKKSLLEWSRVKSGFQQTFADFPHDLDSRLGYIKLGLKANDPESAATAFDNYR